MKLSSDGCNGSVQIGFGATLQGNFPIWGPLYVGIGATGKTGASINFVKGEFSAAGYGTITGDVGAGIGFDIYIAKAQIEAGVYFSLRMSYDEHFDIQESYGACLRGFLESGFIWKDREEISRQGGTGGFVPFVG